MESYDVIIRGFAPGRDEQSAIDLSRVFGIDLARAFQIVTGGPAVAKRALDPNGAERYRRALEEIGAQVAILPSRAGAGGELSRSLPLPAEGKPLAPATLPPAAVETHAWVADEEPIALDDDEDVAVALAAARPHSATPAVEVADAPYPAAEPAYRGAGDELTELWVMGARVESQLAAAALSESLGLSHQDALAAVLTAPTVVLVDDEIDERVAQQVSTLEARGVQVKLRSRRPSVRAVP